MSDTDPIRRFFRAYEATAVGATPEFPPVPADDADGEPVPPPVDLVVEVAPEPWVPRIVGEAPARAGEYPVRFIDGSQTGQPARPGRWRASSSTRGSAAWTRRACGRWPTS